MLVAMQPDNEYSNDLPSQHTTRERFSDSTEGKRNKILSQRRWNQGDYRGIYQHRDVTDQSTVCLFVNFNILGQMKCQGNLESRFRRQHHVHRTSAQSLDIRRGPVKVCHSYLGCGKSSAVFDLWRRKLFRADFSRILIGDTEDAILRPR